MKQGINIVVDCEVKEFNELVDQIKWYLQSMRRDFQMEITYPKEDAAVGRTHISDHSLW